MIKSGHFFLSMVKPCHKALSGLDLILNYDSKDNTAPTREDPLKYFIPVPVQIFSADALSLPSSSQQYRVIPVSISISSLSQFAFQRENLLEYQNDGRFKF